MDFWSIANPMVLFSRIDLFYAVRISTKVLKLLWGPKIKFSILFHFFVKKMCLDERTTILASEFKSDNIWPLFGQKVFENRQHFTSFRPLSGQRGSNAIQFEFWDQIWNAVIKVHIFDHRIKWDWKPYFLALHRNFKTWVLMRMT